MSEPLSTEELLRLEADLAARVTPNPPPHPDLPATPAPRSNLAYVSRAETCSTGSVVHSFVARA